jgi:hypothetical protein
VPWRTIIVTSTIQIDNWKYNKFFMYFHIINITVYYIMLHNIPVRLHDFIPLLSSPSLIQCPSEQQLANNNRKWTHSDACVGPYLVAYTSTTSFIFNHTI